jgi:bleomycin hydrolase
MKKYISGILFVLFVFSLSLFAQKNDEAIYKKIMYGNRERTILSLDFSKLQKPKSLNEFKQVFHTPPVRQDTTNTCWCFSGTSFLESEIKRLGKGEVKLSEMYTVYWEYIEKCRRFIREKGNSLVEEGSEQNAVIKRIKEYGIVRESDFNGLLNGATVHNHVQLIKEVKSYLKYIKENNYWDEEKALEYIKLILNKHIGTPPRTIIVGGKEITPKEYAEKVLQLPLNDYVDLVSLKSFPFYTRGEYDVPDNWWHCDEYFNIPLDEYYEVFKTAISNGYSLSIGGDVSEPGLNGDEDVAIVAGYDCPQQNINQDSREFRFYNKTSTDDHGIHVVGVTKIGKNDWFLIKDSGGGGWRGEYKGYIFYRDDYVKLKMLSVMVHKDAVKDLLKKAK